MNIRRVFPLAVMGLWSISLLCAQAQTKDTIAKNQPEAKKVSAMPSALQKVTVYGFVRNEVIFNSRMNADFREGIGAIYPLDKSMSGNLDKNAYSNLSFSAIATRLGVRFDGVQVLGANVSGRLEGDFFGVSGNTASTTVGTWDLLRLRLAYVKLEWAKASFLAGQDWNPNFLTDCMPGVANFTTGIPFNPYGQMPQLKGTYNFTKQFSIMAMAFMYNLQGFAPQLGTSFNNGMTGAASGIDAQKYSNVPSFALQLTYKSDLVLAGIGAESNTLRPMLADTYDASTNMWGEAVSSTSLLTKVKTLLPTYNLLAYVKLTPKNFVAKLYGNFGQSYTQYVGFGGFAMYRDPTNGAYKYVAQNQLNLWGEFICTKDKMFQPALFLGYDRNLGLAKKLSTEEQSNFVGFYGRGVSTGRTYQDLLKIAPRIDILVNNLRMSLEYEWSSMVWGNNDPATFTAKKGTAGDRFTANNHRVSFLVQYNF